MPDSDRSRISQASPQGEGIGEALLTQRKNHKLCMLRWVKRAIDENDITVLNKKAAEARLKKAESTPKSFQQMERDRTSRVLRGESADGKNIVRDEDLTPEELEAKYA